MAPVKLSASTPFLNPDGTVSRPWFIALVKLIDISNGDITGILPIDHGGTGADNKTDAFDNLSPLTTLGDVLTHDGTNNIRRGIGSAGDVLTVVAGAPQWQASGAPPADATYLTATDESADLPNSRQLLAGDNIAFDDATPNQRTVSATVMVDVAGALDGDGSTASPLAVRVDGTTITINGSNDLEVIGGGSGDASTEIGITRQTGDASETVFDLVDLANYVFNVTVNGATVDPLTYTLSADGGSVTFGTAPGSGEVITFQYVLATI